MFLHPRKEGARVSGQPQAVGVERRFALVDHQQVDVADQADRKRQRRRGIEHGPCPRLARAGGQPRDFGNGAFELHEQCISGAQQLLRDLVRVRLCVGAGDDGRVVVGDRDEAAEHVGVADLAGQHL